MRTLLLCILIAVGASAQAQSLELAGVFADHMVLQREAPLRVWGQAHPGELVRVDLAGQAATTRAGHDGRWQTALAPLKAGGPHRLQVSAGSQRRTLEDVLIGDVWIASGQSNMEWRLADANSAASEIATAGEHPLIRHAKMPHRVSLTPLREAPALRWEVSSPQTAGDFSAVAWHFARRLQTDPKLQNVPIGILNLSWGGTHAETWTSARTNAADPDLVDVMRAVPADAAGFVKQRQAQMLERVRAFQRTAPEAIAGADPALDDSNWPSLSAPQVWETQGLSGLDGQVWLRRHVVLTAAEAAGPVTLHLGPVDDCDETFVNGQPVGRTCGWEALRSYVVPSALLREGDNLIAVRVTDTGGGGGIHGPADQLRLQTAHGFKPLAGLWRARVEAVQTVTEPGPNDLPSLLFNGMVQPFTPFAAKGVIWYQGETNAPRAARYVQTFSRLIKDWRSQWHQAAMPFYFVQLSSYGPRPPLPEGSAFAELRDAQRQTLALPATGMAVSIDVGDANDIHPRDKRTVGERLARIALAQTYRQPVPFKGPTLESSRQLPNGSFELRFSDVGAGLATRGGGPLLGFAVAGDDQRFLPARAEIVGRDRVRVWSEALPRPAAWRYAWADSPLEANLVDGAGLPASPRRSDRWPLATRDIRPEF